MSRLLFALVVAVSLVLASLVEARHIMHRHKHRNRAKTNERTSTAVPEIDGMPIETIRNIKPSSFVPVNNILFYKKYTPCAEGLKRDLFGICREVWD